MIEVPPNPTQDRTFSTFSIISSKTKKFYWYFLKFHLPINGYFSIWESNWMVPHHTYFPLQIWEWKKLINKSILPSLLQYKFVAPLFCIATTFFFLPFLARTHHDSIIWFWCWVCIKPTMLKTLKKKFWYFIVLASLASYY
jgi:hypothetical protein